ncbi:MAG: hypothetical protein KAJ48_04015, partial [Elusimicrobiales bacterium]|nr:hypothetical protein [Elusimicrobiales bacterium]
NVKTAGPYAIIAAYTSADDVIAVKSEGSWYNTSTFTFTSIFYSATYYRYVWNTSAGHEWAYNETIWDSTASALALNADSESGNWYFHVLSYNVYDSSGTDRHMGPFGFDGTFPTATGSSFQTLNSTSGYLYEAELNDLLYSVTAQIKVQDVLSGLIVTTTVAPGENIVAPGGYGVMFSTDKGVTWLTEEMSVSFNTGTQERIYSLAVYGGKLYAGLGGGAGLGDVYEFNGTSWVESFTGDEEYIYALAVYNGKLYAGQGGANPGDGDIYVFDGTSWDLHYGGLKKGFYSLAVYGEKLYAGQGGDTAGDGAVYILGSTWTVSLSGGGFEKTNCLAAYNSSFYAGRGDGAGDGDIYVSSNGINWIISHNGAEENINSLAYYNGKLYAGQGGDNAGDGDILVFTDGTGWAEAYGGLRKEIHSLASFRGKL